MVLAVKDGMIHEVPVQTGIEGDVELEILPGEGEELDETTQIVAAPSEGLTEGHGRDRHGAVRGEWMCLESETKSFLPI